jgi:hypothetical protein
MVPIRNDEGETFMLHSYTTALNTTMAIPKVEGTRPWIVMGMHVHVA